jgi:gamma-glutamylcyclotransferase (GGCT)/AIG2-like uncharacterized protein YtfP
MKYLRYFGYGSNLNLDIMKQRIGEWKSVTKAVLRDYKFVFMPRPGIVIPVIVPSKGDRVLGAVWDITEEQRREIDKFERPYSKRTVEVETEDGMVDALAYVFDMEEFIASVNGYKADWLEGLKQHEYGEEEIAEVERLMAESIEELSR